MANIKLSGKLIILKSNLGTAAIDSYIVGMVKRPIFVTFLANSSSNLALLTLSALSLTVLPQALKIAPTSSLISSTLVLGQASSRISLLSAAIYYISTGATKAFKGCITAFTKLLYIYYIA